MSELYFEQGPIRPTNEAFSILLRITWNCPWNRCEFCHIYKEERFGLRTMEEVKKILTSYEKSFQKSGPYPGGMVCLEKTLSVLMESFIYRKGKAESSLKRVFYPQAPPQKILSQSEIKSLTFKISMIYDLGQFLQAISSFHL